MSLPKPYFQDAAVTIYHGDCRHIVPFLPRFDLLLTDPPYGIGINKSNRLSVSKGFGDQTWDSDAVPRWLIEMLCEQSTYQIMWGGNYYAMSPSRCYLIWDKQNDGRDFADCEHAWTNLDQVARIFRKRPMNMDGGKQHPTQKPLELMTWCLAMIPGVATCLDPFAGSGTTGRACKDLGVKSVLIEREERFCEVAALRMGQEVLPLEGAA